MITLLFGSFNFFSNNFPILLFTFEELKRFYFFEILPILQSEIHMYSTCKAIRTKINLDIGAIVIEFAELHWIIISEVVAAWNCLTLSQTFGIGRGNCSSDEIGLFAFALKKSRYINFIVTKVLHLY